MMLCELVSFVGLMDTCDDNLGRILKIDDESGNIEERPWPILVKWEGNSVTKAAVFR